MRSYTILHVSVAVSILLAVQATAIAGDWPQYMLNAGHTADAADEHLTLPLKLSARIKLDDAILTSPAVVGGRVFVVDQMGTAYCIEAATKKIVWKTSPPGAGNVGGNTSSPCVVDGNVAYGTNSGYFYILSAANGNLLRRVALHQPVFGSITTANERFYLQTHDGVIHCFDLAGEVQWMFDPYADSPTDPGSRAKRQYSGVAVAVSGETVVAASGFDLLCLNDEGDHATLRWRHNRPISDTYLPAGISITGNHGFVSFPGKDGLGGVVRVELSTGKINKEGDILLDQWAVLAPPAIRGDVAYYCRQAFGLSAAEFGDQASVRWSTFAADPASVEPAIAAPSLAGNHCLYPLLSGGLAIANLTPDEGGESKERQVQKLATPTGAPCTSSPAVSGGAVYFGSDDGCLYIARGGSDSEQSRGTLTSVAQRRDTAIPFGERRYAWPSAFGGSANANYVDDPAIQPPFRLRWATKSEGLFKQAICATDDDLVYVTLGGLVVCREQMTGRIRWRRHLPGQAWCRSALLAVEGRLFVPRMFSLRYPKSLGSASTMYCLSIADGKIEWEAPIGIGDRLRASPIYCQGVVAFGSLYADGEPPTFFAGEEAVGQAIDAWDAETGKRLWRVELAARGKLLNGPAGCASGDTMYFTGGGEEPRDSGETLAIEPRTGRVLWRAEPFASQTGTPSYQSGRVYLPGTYQRPMACLDAHSGETVWSNDRSRRQWHVDTVALAPDYFSVNNKYQGGAWRWDLATGKPIESAGEPLQIWGPAHGCGAVVLTSSGHALSATIGGLCMTEADSGKLAWNTAGFGSYTCPHPIASNGRVFYAPQTSGMLFCFEPTSSNDNGKSETGK